MTTSLAILLGDQIGDDTIGRRDTIHLHALSFHSSHISMHVWTCVRRFFLLEILMQTTIIVWNVRKLTIMLDALTDLMMDGLTLPEEFRP